MVGLKFSKIASFFESNKSVNQVYKRLVGHDLDLSLLQDFRYPVYLEESLKKNTLSDQIRLLDFHNYLVDDVLCKVDRASMANGIEARAPFLDKDVIELGFSLPQEYRFNGKLGKRILRDILSEMLPKDLIVKPKKGFSVPLGSWLREPEFRWVEDYIFCDNTYLEEYISTSEIERLWDDHTKRRTNNQGILWSIINLNNWLENTKSWLY